MKRLDLASVVFSLTLNNLSTFITSYDPDPIYSFTILDELEDKHMFNPITSDPMKSVLSFYGERIHDLIAVNTPKETRSRDTFIFSREKDRRFVANSCPRVLLLLCNVMKNCKENLEESFDSKQCLDLSIATILFIMNKSIIENYDHMGIAQKETLLTTLFLDSEERWNIALDEINVVSNNDDDNYLKETRNTAYYMITKLTDSEPKKIDVLDYDTSNDTKIISSLSKISLSSEKADQLFGEIRKALKLAIAGQRDFELNDDTLYKIASDVLLEKSATHYLEFVKRWRRNLWSIVRNDCTRDIKDVYDNHEFRDHLTNLIEERIQENFELRVSSQTVKRLESRVYELLLIMCRQKLISHISESHCLQLEIQESVMMIMMDNLLSKSSTIKDYYVDDIKELSRAINEDNAEPLR